MPPMRIGGAAGRGARARQGALQPVVAALERRGVARPHALRDLQRLLQPLEALGDRRQREPKRARLRLVVARAEAEPGAAAGEHVEGRGGLDQQRGLAVGHRADHRAEPDALRVGGEDSRATCRPRASRCPGRWSARPGRGGRPPTGCRCPRRRRPGRCDARAARARAVRPRVVGEGEADLHAATITIWSPQVSGEAATPRRSSCRRRPTWPTRARPRSAW